MALPSVETVSSVAFVYGDDESSSAQVDDPAMIAALLEALNGESIQTLNGQGWEYGFLTMQHKDYPFLQCRIKCCYSLEQEISYCQNGECEWFPLPAEWFAAISEHDFPIQNCIDCTSGNL